MNYLMLAVVWLNLLVLCWVAWREWKWGDEWRDFVESIIRDEMSQEVRRQDDRIQKRIERGPGEVLDTGSTNEAGYQEQMIPGRSYRRQ